MGVTDDFEKKTKTFKISDYKELVFLARDIDDFVFTIALNYTIPEITVNDLGMEAFPDLLASFSTNYVTSPSVNILLKLFPDSNHPLYPIPSIYVEDDV